jgi:hypothetical protein
VTTVLTVVLAAVQLFAQTPAQPTGRWEGAFTGPAGEVTIALDLRRANGRLTGTLSTGDVKGLPLSELTLEGAMLRFDVPTAGARFSGTVNPDGKTIAGEFVNQAGAAPTVLTRTGEARVESAPKSAAVGKELEGKWSGTMEVDGRTKRYLLTMTNQPDGSAVASIVSVDDGGIEIPVGVTQKQRTLLMDVRMTGGSYLGTLNAAGDEIAGPYTERGIQFQLTFKR